MLTSFTKRYYNTYKNDYDADDKLNVAKKKKFDNKRFELVDKTNKELKLGGETKDFVKEIKKREKNVDKKGFIK